MVGKFRNFQNFHILEMFATCLKLKAARPPSQGPTSDSDVDALRVHLVGLHHHLAVVLASVHLLHVAQFERAVVLEGPLAVVEGQQRRVLVPFDGVVGVADHPAVDEGVPPGDGRDVLHGTDVGAAWRRWAEQPERERETEGQRERDDSVKTFK